MNSPLEIRNYYFDKLDYRINTDVRLDGAIQKKILEDASTPPLVFSVSLLHNASDHSLMGLSMQVTYGKNPEDLESDSLWRFYVHSEIFGEFGMKDDPSKRPEGFDERKYVVASGTSILYGILRDRIDQMTTGSPVGRILLPVVSFAALAKKMTFNDEPSADESAEPLRKEQD